MAMMGDERLAKVMAEWWYDEPVEPLPEGHAVIDDTKSLLAHLDKHGYEIVRKTDEHHVIECADCGAVAEGGLPGHYARPVV